MYRLIDGIPVFGIPLDNAVEQMKNCAPDAAHSALMADHHLGYTMPVGGVLALKDKVAPVAVGVDIGCGNKAVRLDITCDKLAGRMSELMDEVFNSIEFGVGRKNSEVVEHDIFKYGSWDLPIAKDWKEKAQAQLGTVGGGNHYVDIFSDELSNVWIGVHFGSRGLGHTIAQYYIKAAGGKDNKLGLLDIGSELGAEYIDSMMLAGWYAYAGRDWVCQKVASIIGAEIVEEVHNHHNFAWFENHFGEQFWVVRKGATPAFPGQRGFIGGSMGDNAVIVEGIDSPESSLTLHSTVHGAGRIMSRTEAKGFNKYKKNKVEGKISEAMMKQWVGDKGVVLRGGEVDEAPQAYKRLPEVLEAHKDSIKILHVLTPLGVAMAGKGVEDPWKD